MPEQIQQGFMVFVADGELGVGAVREVREGGELLVNIQNAGDFVISPDSVRDVHSGKVILDIAKLDAPLREALHHPHDAEDPDYAAVDPQDGALKD